MVISPSVKPLGIAAAIIGIIQGVVWAILGLIAILLYEGVWEPVFDDSYGQHLSFSIISLYFKSIATSTLLYIHPLALFVCAIVYLIGSVFWIGLSSYQLWAITSTKDDLLKKAYFGWANWTLVLCVYDVVLASFLAKDYDTLVKIVNLKTNSTKDDYMLILACGVMMTLVARGFVLWIVNVTLAMLVMKLSMGISKKRPVNDLNFNVIEAFGASAVQERDWDEDKPKMTRSNSFVSSKSFGTFHGLPRLPRMQANNDRLTKTLGHNSAQRTSPTNNTTPTVLSPSYLYSGSSSPSYGDPKSPVPPSLKSALKNRAQSSYG